MTNHPRSPEPHGGRNSPSLREVTDAMARDIAERLSPGDVSQLRRMKPEDPGCPAFWKLLAAHLEPAGLLPQHEEWRDEAERRWAVLLRGMAATRGLHQRGRYLGHALAEAKVSEDRFLRLLRAHGDALFDALRITAHQIATAGERLDWGDLADLVFSDGRPHEESVRRRIARDFYARTASATRGEADE